MHFSWLWRRYFEIKLDDYYTELNALSNKPNSSLSFFLSMGSKSRKTAVVQGRVFKFKFFGGKLLIAAGGRSYIICRVFRGLSNAENPIQFGPEIRKLRPLQFFPL